MVTRLPAPGWWESSQVVPSARQGLLLNWATKMGIAGAWSLQGEAVWEILPVFWKSGITAIGTHRMETLLRGLRVSWRRWSSPHRMIAYCRPLWGLPWLQAACRMLPIVSPARGGGRLFIAVVSLFARCWPTSVADGRRSLAPGGAGVSTAGAAVRALAVAGSCRWWAGRLRPDHHGAAQLAGGLVRLFARSSGMGCPWAMVMKCLARAGA